MKDLNPPSYGDIVILAKGKLKKFANESFLFEEIHDVCEYECQNDAEKYLENVNALWMVERIRHRDNARGYRYDLRFTIVPIYNENGKSVSNNLEERLRNQLKKTFILRDTDYPKYFQHLAPKATVMRRSDQLDRSYNAAMMNPNHINVHNIFGYSPTPKLYQVNGDRLNTGEYYKKQFSMPKPIPMNSFYIPNVNHRYPIRFPDSRESLKNSPYRLKPMKEEEKQEAAQNIANVVDHRGAVDLNKQHQSVQNTNVHTQSKPLPGRSTNLFIPQPAIAVPIIVPQMSLIPSYLQLQVSTPSNQILYSQQPDITTFRYPIHPFLNTQQTQQQQQYSHYVPPFQYLHAQTSSSQLNKTKIKPQNFKQSEVHHSAQGFSLPDPIYHAQLSSSTTEKSIYPTQYTPKLSNYVTASSIQINSYDNTDFLPIDPPSHMKGRKSTTSSEKNIIITTEKSKLSNFKHYETRNRQSIREKIPKTTQPQSSYSISTTTTSASSSSSPSTTTQFPRNHHQFSFSDGSNYDVVATRPSITKRTNRTTTEKPILKWLPKKHRNKTSLGVTNYSTSTTQSPSSIETTTISSQSNIHPSRAATQVYRGRNRFYSSKRNSTTSSVTEKSTTLLSSMPNHNLKLLKRKASTTLLPISITTQQTPSASSFITTTPLSSFSSTKTTTVFPTNAYDITSSTYETIEPVTLQPSYSTSISLQVDDGDDKIGTTMSYELIPAGVEKIITNSSNIQIYKASEGDSDETYKEKIDDFEIESIINHAKSIEADVNKAS